MKRINLPALLIAILLFALGTVVGALAHRYYSPTVVVANSSESFRKSMISEMQSRLALTPSQVSSLQSILDRTKAQMKAIRDRNHPEVVKIKEEQIGRVKEMLTPVQQHAYDVLLAERERRYREQEARDRQSNHKAETPAR